MILNDHVNKIMLSEDTTSEQFKEKNYSMVVISDTVNNISYRTFFKTNIQQLIIKSRTNILKIQKEAFRNATIKKVLFEDQNAFLLMRYEDYFATPFSARQPHVYINGQTLKHRINDIINNEMRLLQQIEPYIFCNLKWLTQFTINESISSIKEGAFCFCSNLKELSFTINKANKNIKLLTLYPKAFAGCGNIEKVHVSSFEVWLKKITTKEMLDRNEESCTASPLYSSKNAKLFINHQPISAFEVIQIPDSVEEIPPAAFLHQPLNHVRLSSSCAVIFEFAFSQSTIKSLTCPENAKLKEIGQCAFANCEQLAKVELPNTVTSIYENAFSDCRALNFMYIPNNVTTIEKNAFRGCEGLTLYCAALSKPEGFDDDWNGGRPVYWGVDKKDIIILQGIQYLIKNGKAVVTGTTTEFKKTDIIPSKIKVNNQFYDVIHHQK